MWQRYAISALCLTLVACGAGTEESASDQAPQTTRIIAHEIAYVLDARQIEAVGTARAKSAAIVRPETGGEVEEVLFQTGDLVEAGAPLIRLESDAETLAVALARVSLVEAKQLLERYKRIEDTGAVSDTAIDEARTAVESAGLELQQDELALARRTVVAPFTGYVGLTDIDPGARVTPETEITRIDDRRTLYVDFEVPEEVYGQLEIGETVAAVPFGAGDRIAEAKVVALDSRIDPVSRAFTARAAIENADDRLRPGMSFKVRFGVPGQEYPAVPEAAIVWGGDGAYLWAVRDGVAARVPVAIVSRRQGEVLVDADLPEGSLIVAEGVQKVREGSPVETSVQQRRTGAGTASSAGL